MSEQKLSFQAEVSRLLEIVANSLYSNKEIFLRELISNASDACDRLRYAALTQPDLTAADPDYKIALSSDAEAGTLTVADNGIGMNRDEMIENLGTIARSGTANFVRELEAKPEGVNLIGQFGVGFYSAFMVADSVEVTSRRAGESQGWRWLSDGRGEFTVAETDTAPARGTRVVLKLKKGQEEFLDPLRLERIVRTYSDHIAIPVTLTKDAGAAGDGAAGDGGAGDGGAEDGGEQTLNAASALWTRPKSEISEEQYKEFYHHVAHAFDEPWLRLHFRAEGVIEYTGLLYLPSTKPFDLFQPERKHGVKLYVRRVFITDDCEGLVPSYLRFLRGVIDSEDLPLNISREILQTNPVLAKIRDAVTKRVLKEIEKRAKKKPEEYASFWDNFGPVLKEGLYEDEGRRETLIELARFASTRDGGMVGLADYVARMPEGQEEIYYISGQDAGALRKSPQLEGFAARGVEVLLMSDPVDEFWLPVVREYQGKAFKSVTRGGAELDKIADAAKDDDAAANGDAGEDAAGPGTDALIAFVKLALKDEVKDVRTSERLTDSPVCLVADEGDIDMHLERLLKQHKQIDQASQRILEINPKHALIRRLAGELETQGAAASDAADGAAPPLEEAARLLLDQARILEGEPLPDPSAFARRLSRLVARGFGSEDS
ncbi:MAG: molecular chaperone HtpG [Alphaproteobacteria bacterium]